MARPSSALGASDHWAGSIGGRNLRPMGQESGAGKGDRGPERGAPRRLASDAEAERLKALILEQGGVEYCPETAREYAREKLLELTTKKGTQ